MTRETIKRVSVVLIPVFLCAVGMAAACFAQNATVEEALEEGSEVTVTGELFKIKMTEFPDNPWQEMAIKDESGKACILIGKLAKEIRKDEGKKVTVIGKVMPAMMVKGKAMPVIQIAEIKAAAAEEKK